MDLSRVSTPGAWYLDTAPATTATWLSRLRWVRAAVDLSVLLAALTVSQADFPLYRLAPLVALSAFVNGDIALQSSRGRMPASWLRGAALIVDVVLLTGLLELSGGPSNPFVVVYALLVGLAGALLGIRWAYAIGAVAVVSFGVLISWHLEELVPAHHRLIDFPTHLFTMWLTIVFIMELAAHFVREASAAIARRESQIEDMRQQATRAERLMSLTTLAAGAAHELSTPLATVAVAARELDRALAGATPPSALADDARLIREEIERCHVILDQMSGRAGGTAADVAEPTDLAALFEDLRQRLPPDQAGRIRTYVEPPHAQVVLPRAGLTQVLLSLVKNAFDASRPPLPVVLEGVRDRRAVRLIVRDQGPGMADDVLRRAGEPFFTTKEAGEGSGLGLFLARMFAERLGGTLTLTSDGGTVAILELPIASDAVGRA